MRQPTIVALLFVVGGLMALSAAKKFKVKDIERDFNDNEGQQRRREIQLMVDEVVRRGKGKSGRDRKGNSLRRGRHHGDGRGKHTRLEQEYDGIRVLGQELVVHVISGGDVALIDKRTDAPTGDVVHVEPEEYISGSFVDDLQLDLGHVDSVRMGRKKGRVWRNTARKHAKGKGRGRKGKGKGKGRGRGPRAAGFAPEDDSEPIIYVEAESDEPPIVGYLVKIWEETDEGPTFMHRIVDEDGNILKEWEGLNTDRKLREKRDVVAEGEGPGGNEKMGKYQYGETKPNLHVHANSGTNRCKFETTNVRTVNLDHEWSNRKTTAHEFDCYTQQGDEVNGGYSALNDAHHFGSRVFDMYKQWYQSSPLESVPLQMKVHYGSGYENAFWDGKSMTFGDGRNYFHPLVSLDVVAHEVSHGVTQQSSNLLYYGESGGLNEAFSDMAGKAAERFSRGFDANTFEWGVGHDITKGSSPLRCMDNPKCDGRSIDHVRDMHDGLNVHFSSGVYNKVFFLLSNKLKYDVWDAFDLFYIANTKFWHSSTTFTQAAELLLKVTEELKAGKHLPWSYSHINIGDITGALSQVGILCQKSTTWACTKQP